VIAEKRTVLSDSALEQNQVITQQRLGAGYSLVRQGGTLRFVLSGANGAEVAVSGKAAIADGAWHHIVAEYDRAAGTLSLFVDGKLDARQAVADPGSLANAGALTVGGTAAGRSLEGDLDFLRICRGSLADAQTSIEELHAWQFNGPQLRDFVGNEPQGHRDAGAIEAVSAP